MVIKATEKQANVLSRISKLESENNSVLEEKTRLINLTKDLEIQWKQYQNQLEKEKNLRIELKKHR